MATLSEIIREHQEDYASLELSETIHQLQIQLQAAIDVASGLKEENSVLTSSLEDCRASNAAYQRRSEEWRETWKKEVDAVTKREKQLLLDENAWDKKLQEKRALLDEIESQLMEKKAEAKRIYDFNDEGASTNHDIKIEQLEKEVDKWRQLFYEAEKMSNKEEMEFKYQHEVDMNKTLRKELASLQQLYAERLETDNSTKQTKYQEKVTELMLKVDEMELAAEKLREEAIEMRKSRDEAVHKWDAQNAKHQVEYGVSCFIYFALASSIFYRSLTLPMIDRKHSEIVPGTKPCAPHCKNES